MWAARDGRKIRKTFKTHGEARSWQATAQQGVQSGTIRAPSKLTIRQAAEAWLGRARTGEIRNRSGDRYKPSALRGYDQALELRVLPAIGGHRLSDVGTADLQRLADGWLRDGHSPSTIRNTFMPLRAIYRWAKTRLGLPINPCDGLQLAAVRGRRERIVAPDEAAALVSALPPEQQALWATALYSGLRRGELRALRWDSVNLATGTIEVVTSWDSVAGPIEPKSRAGRRTVPIPAILRDVLLEHQMQQGRQVGLVFGRAAESAFVPGTVNERADRVWKAKKLEPIRLHEARHSYASYMIAAGVNAKALSTYMGHSSIQITFDRYGHLMPGHEDAAGGLLDAFLAEHAAAQARKGSRSSSAPAL